MSVYPGQEGSWVHREREETTLDDPGCDCRWVGFTVHMRIVQSDHMHSCGGCSFHANDKNDYCLQNALISP